MVAGFAKLHFVDSKLGARRVADCRMARALRRRRRQCLLGRRQPAIRSSSRAWPPRPPKARNSPSCPAPRCAPRVTPAGQRHCRRISTRPRAPACLWSATRSRRRRRPASPKATSARASRSRRARSATPRWPSCASAGRPNYCSSQDQIRRAEERREREQASSRSRRCRPRCPSAARSSARCWAARRSPPPTSGASGPRRARPRASGRESQDVTRAEESLEVLQQRLDDTQREVEAEVARLETTLDRDHRWRCAPWKCRRANPISPSGEVALVWAPWRKGADGFPAPAYD